MLNKIVKMFKNCDENNCVLPSTELYNESWMIRIIIDWFSNYSGNQHPFSFLAESKWYSEALLPSIFLKSYNGDKLAESWTHADAVIGNFTVGNSSKSDLQLIENANQFLVIEAKMFSELSRRTTNASNYDQASRTVACMAETLKRATIEVDEFEKLGFYVIAPSSQIEKRSSFRSYTNIETMKSKVFERVEAYSSRAEYPKKKSWFDRWFMPMLDKIDIQCLSWEEVIEFITIEDTDTGEKMASFYEKCIMYNQKVS